MVLGRMRRGMVGRQGILRSCCRAGMGFPFSRAFEGAEARVEGLVLRPGSAGTGHGGRKNFLQKPLTGRDLLHNLVVSYIEVRNG
jgi:hypothetical protein